MLNTYYRENSGDDDFDELFVGDEQGVLDSRFDGARKTKLLVHGYGDSGRTGWVRRMKDAYLTKGELGQLSVAKLKRHKGYKVVAAGQLVRSVFPFRGLQRDLRGLGVAGRPPQLPEGGAQLRAGRRAHREMPNKRDGDN